MPITRGQTSIRDRLYQTYASQHAGYGHRESVVLSYRRDIRPALPAPDSGPVVDLGCGQGELVRLLVDDGYDAQGIDISQEQVAIAHAGGIGRVQQGDYSEILHQCRELYAAVTATDLLEHLTKPEVLATFDCVAAALVPGGVFVARVPNAVSPLAGHIQYGDFTHESVFTARSIRQIAAAAGFDAVNVRPCPPVKHGIVSAGRAALWKAISTGYRIALAAETGTLSGHIFTQNLTFVARKK